MFRRPRTTQDSPLSAPGTRARPSPWRQTHPPTGPMPYASSSLSPSKHECSQHEIQREYRQRRGHHRARGRTRHTLGGRRSVIALEHRDPGYRDAEHHALDHAVEYVLLEVDRSLHLRPERAFIDPNQAHADQIAAEYAH